MCGSCPCSSTRAKLLRLRRALLRQRGDLQVERGATITSEKVKTIQTKCFTFTEEMRSGLGGETFTGVTSEPGSEYDLIAQEVESAEYRKRVSSTYTMRARTRGVILHMLGGQEACTEGAVIHKAAVRRYGHKGAHQGAH